MNKIFVRVAKKATGRLLAIANGYELMNIKGPYVLPAAFFGEKSTAQTEAEIVSIPAYISPLWYSSGLPTDALLCYFPPKKALICVDIKAMTQLWNYAGNFSQVSLHIVQGHCKLLNGNLMKIVLVTLPWFWLLLLSSSLPRREPIFIVWSMGFFHNKESLFTQKGHRNQSQENFL